MVNLPKISKVRIPYVHHLLKPKISTSTSTSVTLTPVYDANNGIVNWIIDNGTPSVKYFVIYRGAVVGGYTIRPYPFGNAFWPDYLGSIEGQTISAPITSLNNIQPYSIGVINNSLVAFVFQLQPYTTLQVPEGGFTGLQQLSYTLVEVTPDKLNPYIIFWSWSQYFDYVLQTGFSTTPVSWPYVASIYNFNTSFSMSPEFQDIILKNYIKIIFGR